jgi:hypothetical protein
LESAAAHVWRPPPASARARSINRPNPYFASFALKVRMRFPACNLSHLGQFGLKHNRFDIPVDSQQKKPAAGEAPGLSGGSPGSTANFILQMYSFRRRSRSWCTASNKICAVGQQVLFRIPSTSKEQGSP